QVRTYYSSNRISARQSFSTQDFLMQNLYGGYESHHYRRQYYDALDWFGFSLRNDYYINRNYLSRIAEETYYSSVHPSIDENLEKGVINGKITDDAGAPLAGAIISIKGKKTQTATD